MRKKTLFKIIAVLLPLFLIVIVEIILRIVGYGEDYRLFHRMKIANRPDYLVMNDAVAGKYFRNKDYHSDNQSDIFLRTKTDSTFRIFVQGASTVVGFPYYGGGSFPRMLKHRLSRTFPDMNIEVVNTGITAVNSYTLLDLTDAIIAQKPDLVIIYAGHNEYYGALGVGSTSSYGSHPLLIRTYLFLKDFRFFQLLENGFSGLFKPADKVPKLGATTLMEVMAREQRIPVNSQIYASGIRQFQQNFKDILNKYKENKIPVILSTLVSNEKDVKPFISDSIPDKNGFLTALEAHKPEANKIAMTNATAAYILGHYYLEKDQDTAKKYLHLAKELDLLRFRAPEKINAVIKDLAKAQHTPLVDMKRIFLSASPDGIIGDELLAEHVHPNIKGNFLMADAFYNKIKELNLLKDWNNYIPYDEAIQDIPVTKIDSIKGKFIVEDLKQSWPYDLKMAGSHPLSTYHSVFNPTYEERKAIAIYSKVDTWKNVILQAREKYDRDKNYKEELHVAESLIFEYPEQGDSYQLAGEICLKLNDLKGAFYYFFKYNALDKSSASAEQLASVYLMLDKKEEAQKILTDARNRGLKVKDLAALINKKSPSLMRDSIN